jgi:hypothetical protein
MFKKKFLTLLIALAIVFTFGAVTPVKALTVAELQAEIDSLLRILAGLQAQLVLSSYHIPENVLNKNLSSYSSVTAFVDDLASSTATSTNGSATTSTAQPIINVVKAMADLGMTITDMSSEYGTVGALVNSIVATGDPADVKDLLVAIKNLGGTYSSLKTSIGGVKGLFTTIQQNLGSKRLPYLTGLLEDLKDVGGTWADVTIDSGFSSLKALIIKLSKKDNLEDLAAILAKLAELQKKYDDLYASSTKLYQLVAALDKHNDPLYDRCYSYTNRNSGNYYPSSSYYDPCRSNDYSRYGLSPFFGDLARPLAGNRNPQSAFSTNPRNYGSGSGNPLAGRSGNPAGSTGFSTNPKNYGSGSGNLGDEVQRIDTKTIKEVYDCKIAEEVTVKVGQSNTIEPEEKKVEKDKKVKVYLVDKSKVIEEPKSTKSTALFNFTRRLLASAGANASPQAPATKVQQPLYIVEYPGISQNNSTVQKTNNDGKITYYELDNSEDGYVWSSENINQKTKRLTTPKKRVEVGDNNDIKKVVSSLAIRKGNLVNYTLYDIPIKLKECSTSSDSSKKTTDSAQDNEKFSVESARLIVAINRVGVGDVDKLANNTGTQQSGTQSTTAPKPASSAIGAMTSADDKTTSGTLTSKPVVNLNPSNYPSLPKYGNMDSATFFSSLQNKSRVGNPGDKHFTTTDVKSVSSFLEEKNGQFSYYWDRDSIPAGLQDRPAYFYVPSELTPEANEEYKFVPGYYNNGVKHYYYDLLQDHHKIDFWDIVITPRYHSQ